MLGLVQGFTEFLPVSSSGHLMIVKELLGVDADNFLNFTVTVHFATVLSTIVVFWKVILELFKGLFKFKWNDETDYICKLLVSMVPVAIVGFLFKDKVEILFGSGLVTVACSLIVTAVLLLLSDLFGDLVQNGTEVRNGISWWQALVVGVGQALAVIPGLSRSGTTIATGLVCGVKREKMAQFSFLMVLVPILGEQLLDVLKMATGHAEAAAGAGVLALVLGFIAAFASGLLACSLMLELVRRARLRWFAAYCALVAVLIFIFHFV